MCTEEKDTNSINLCDEVVAKAEEMANEMGTTVDDLAADNRHKVLDRLWNEAAIEVHGGDDEEG